MGRKTLFLDSTAASMTKNRCFWATLLILLIILHVPIGEASSTGVQPNSTDSGELQDPSNVLQLRMNEGIGKVAYDSSSYNNDGILNAHHGTRYGATWTYGKYGKALSFDGADDYVVVGYSPSLEMSSFTVAFWAYPTSLSWERCVVGNRATECTFDVKFRSNGLHGDIGNGQSWLTTAADYIFTPSVNTWYHVAYAVTSGGNCKIYLNGDYKTTITFTGTPKFVRSDGNVKVGQVGYGQEWFSGVIDDVRVYNYALTSDEFSRLYSGEDLRPGLAGEWRFDEGSGDTAADTHMWYDEKYGGSLRFDGVDDYVSLQSNPSTPSAITVAAWVKRTAYYEQEKGIVTRGGGWSTRGWSLYTNWDMRPRFIVSDAGGDTIITSPNVLPLNQWRHVAVSHDGAYLRLYEDGSLVSGPLPCTRQIVETYGINLGRLVQLSGNYVPAVVDEVYVYNRALTQGEIAQLMNPPAADLKTWYHIGTSYYIDGWVDLGIESYYDRVAQVFSPPGEWSVNTISLYAGEGLGLMAKNKTREDQNKTKVTIAYVHVELRSGDPYGELLASGSLYVTYSNWYDATLDHSVTLSPGNQYCIVAYSGVPEWHIYYHNDGHPDDDGYAYRRRYVWPPGWEYMAVDFMVRYRAEYTINAERTQHLQDLAEMYKPFIQHEVGETWFACDFYYDRETDISNNPANWGQRGQHTDWDPEPRVFIHIEEYVFHDSMAWEEKPMIAIEYWYYYVYNEHPTWPDHDHDFELHTIVFLDQESESVLKLGYAHHWSIAYYEWSVADWIGTHPVAYVAKGSHAADEDRDIPWEGFPWGPGWEGDGEQLSWTAFKSVFVLHTDPCRDHSTNYCKIVYNDCWQGYHFWWGYSFARDWWPKEFPGLGAPAPWHRYTWDEPTTGNSAN